MGTAVVSRGKQKAVPIKRDGMSCTEKRGVKTWVKRVVSTVRKNFTVMGNSV